MAINDACYDADALQRARGAVATNSGWIETNGDTESAACARAAGTVSVSLRQVEHAARHSGARMLVDRIRRPDENREVRAGPACHSARRRPVLPGIAMVWTKVDRLVRARLIAKVDAYRGAGKPAAGGPLARFRDALPPQHIRELYQLYIPGMNASDLAERTFAEVSDMEIWRADVFV